ncbi:hypothetical protein Aduo_008906 [Ancylostoma duodenale]
MKKGFTSLSNFAEQFPELLRMLVAFAKERSVQAKSIEEGEAAGPWRCGPPAIPQTAALEGCTTQLMQERFPETRTAPEGGNHPLPGKSTAKGTTASDDQRSTPVTAHWRSLQV